MIWRPTWEPATIPDGRIAPSSSHFKQPPGSWIVTWYGRVGHPRGNNTVPPVEVYFNALAEDGTVLPRYIIKEPPLSFLDVFRIGSVWDGHVCRKCARFSEAVFDVSYDESDWNHPTLGGAIETGEAWAREFADFYPLAYENDQTSLISFRLGQGGRLIVPCLEFFTALYGFSSELKRILATYPWDEAESRLYSPLEDDNENEGWVVSPGLRLVSDDGMFLAWIKYNAYAREQAKRIFSQLQGASAARWNPLKVSPWWKGNARLKVEGFPLNGGDDFIGLRISGASLPDNKVTVIMPARPERETVGEGEDSSEESFEEKSEVRTLVKRNKKSPLSQDELPDHSGSLEVHDLKEFEVLNGARPMVVSSRKKLDGGKGGRAVPQERDEHAASTDEPYGDGKGVAKGVIATRRKMESEGILRDMCNALVALRDKTEGITYVGWYDQSLSGFREGEPILVEVNPPRSVKESTKPRERRWPFLKGEQLRGFLVVKVVTTEGTAFIIEIERRVIGTRNTSDNEKSQKEESFKGLVFKLDDEKLIHKWVAEFASKVCENRGRLDKIAPLCPGEAHTFKHRNSKNDSCPYEAAALNALRKAGIVIAHAPSSES